MPPGDYTRREFLRLSAALAGLPLALAACGAPEPTPTPVPPARPTATPVSATPAPRPTMTPTAAAVGAFATGVYRNLFVEHGKPDADVAARIDAAWASLFASADDERRVYYPAGSNANGPLAYVEDIGNGDVRTEGMSYGMMIAVQLDQHAAFDALWNWAKTYMQHAEGPWQGYFAWHNRPDGRVIDANPASDGEQWFATALYFAAGRWGDGSGVYRYRAEADAILNTMLHKRDLAPASGDVTAMFDRAAQQVVFVPSGDGATYTDPSYHLPAFYELWSRWARGYAGQQTADRAFWRAAAHTSRAFFRRAADPGTGLTPDYANFDGTPHDVDGHGAFRFDAFRTVANVALDYAWFAADPAEVALCDRLQAFFAARPGYANQYTLDGRPLSTDRSPGLIAMNAVAGLAAAGTARAGAFVDALWALDVPTGHWRYYDGLLYLLALLYAGGRFRIYAPG